MALSAARYTGSRRVIRRDKRPLAAVKVFRGGLAACRAGFYRPATSGSGAGSDVIVGRFLEDVDNSGGGAGDKSAEIEFFRDRECFLLNNDTGTAVVAADRETPCYVKDDETVSGSSTNAAPAGIVYDVTSDGVWVDMISAVPGDQGATGPTGPTGPTG